MIGVRVVVLAGCLVTLIAWRAQTPAAPQPGDATARAVRYLTREVPRWHAEEGCFSCHNNGDAAPTAAGSLADAAISARAASPLL